jgi:hypothetical protein
MEKKRVYLPQITLQYNPGSYLHIIILQPVLMSMMQVLEAIRHEEEKGLSAPNRKPFQNKSPLQSNGGIPKALFSRGT